MPCGLSEAGKFLSSLKYRSDIDGLRALAVLSVVIYHVSPQSLPGGFFGVDIFFVISGYLISLIVFREQAAGTFSFSDFYSRRIRRLFPALAVVLLATLALGAIALFPDEYERLGKHSMSSIVFLLNFQLMGEAGYFDVVSDSKPLLHLWSLSVEEQFYLAWPTVLVLAGRLRVHVTWVIGCLLIASFAFAIYLASSNLDSLYFHPLARFWELLLGAALAYSHHRAWTNYLTNGLNCERSRHLLSLAGLAAIIGALFWSNGKDGYPGMLTAIPLVGVVVLIASGSRSVGNRFLAAKPLVWVGLISYPLYLWHWPLLSYIRIAESGSPAKVSLWLGAGVAVALAAITYRFIELPLRQAKLRARVVAGLSSAMALLFLASFGVKASQGLPDRPNVAYMKAAEAQMKREPASDELCQSLFSPGNAPVYCRMHNPSQKMIGIIGDSHAHVLFPGVSELAAKRGYGTVLFANSGCPPFLGAVTGRNEVERQTCEKSIRVILDAVRNDKRIVSVVMASRGPQYILGTGFGPVEASYNYPPITTEPPPAIGSEITSGTVFFDGLFNTARQLHQLGINVSYLLQVPELGVPARNCLGRPLTLALRADHCLIEIGVYRDRMQSYRKQIFALANAVDYLKIIDVEPVFCNNSGCSGMVDDQLLYADDNHLSVVGSRAVAPIILDAALADGHSR